MTPKIHLSPASNAVIKTCTSMLGFVHVVGGRQFGSSHLHSKHFHPLNYCSTPEAGIALIHWLSKPVRDFCFPCSLTDLPLLTFYFCDKHYNQKQLMEERVRFGLQLQLSTTRVSPIFHCDERAWTIVIQSLRVLRYCPP